MSRIFIFALFFISPLFLFLYVMDKKLFTLKKSLLFLSFSTIPLAICYFLDSITDPYSCDGALLILFALSYFMIFIGIVHTIISLTVVLFNKIKKF